MRSSLVNYHCVPWQGGTEVCKDGVSRPHRTGGRRLRLHRRGDVVVRTGIPAVSVSACVERTAVRCLKSLGWARPIGDRGDLWLFKLPARFPSRTHRISIFVQHPDGNGGSTEVAVKVVRGRDRDPSPEPPPQGQRKIAIVGGSPGPLMATFTGGPETANEVGMTADEEVLAVSDASGPIDAGAGTSACTGGGTPAVSCPNNGLAFAMWRLGDGTDRFQAGPKPCPDDQRLPNLVLAGPGNDHAVGGSSEDGMRGGPGADVLVGCAWLDTLFGEAGPDQLSGGAAPDRLMGGGGADRLLGGSGRDLLSGGGGDDVLEGGSGLDSIRCGAGRDLVIGEPRWRLPDSCERARAR